MPIHAAPQRGNGLREEQAGGRRKGGSPGSPAPQVPPVFEQHSCDAEDVLGREPVPSVSGLPERTRLTALHDGVWKGPSGKRLSWLRHGGERNRPWLRAALREGRRRCGFRTAVAPDHWREGRCPARAGRQGGPAVRCSMTEVEGGRAAQTGGGMSGRACGPGLRDGDWGRQGGPAREDGRDCGRGRDCGAKQT